MVPCNNHSKQMTEPLTTIPNQYYGACSESQWYEKDDEYMMDNC